MKSLYKKKHSQLPLLSLSHTFTMYSNQITGKLTTAKIVKDFSESQARLSEAMGKCHGRGQRSHRIHFCSAL